MHDRLCAEVKPAWQDAMRNPSASNQDLECNGTPDGTYSRVFKKDTFTATHSDNVLNTSRFKYIQTTTGQLMFAATWLVFRLGHGVWSRLFRAAVGRDEANRVGFVRKRDSGAVHGILHRVVRRKNMDLARK